jgi:small subunit ribosomal protein S21
LKRALVLEKPLHFLTLRRSISSMTEVIINSDESFEKALKRFKKKCERAGILSDLRKHRHFEKPSERRKRKLSAARRKHRRSY